MKRTLLTLALLACTFPVSADFPQKITIGEEALELRTIAEIRKLGFECEDIPWKDNAARVYIEAGNACRAPVDADEAAFTDALEEAVDSLDFTEIEEEAAAYLEENTPSFVLVKQADVMPRYAWVLGRDDGLIGGGVRQLGKAMEMGRHLNRRAAFEFYSRRDRDAVDTCFVGLRWARRIGEGPFLVNGLVGLWGQGLYLSTLHRMVASGRFDDATLADVERRLRESGIDMTRQYADTLLGERVFALHEVERFEKHGLKIWDELNDFVIGEPLTPQGEDERRKWRETFEPDVTRKNVGGIFDFLDAQARLPMHEAWKPENRFAAFRARHEKTWDPTTRMFKLDTVENALRGFAGKQVVADVLRVRIALERYKLAAKTYPGKLNALVPKYLAKLPNDPYTGKPYRYETDEAGDFRVWSIGDDLKDDGGVSDEGNPWAGPDHVFTSKRQDEPEEDDD